jgi:CBS domain-containing protein
MPAALPTFRVQPSVTLAQAEPWQFAPVTLASPAIEVMTDLTRFKAATTQPETSLRQAEQMMIYQGVRMLFVVTDMPALAGLITTTDLRGERQMRLVHERNLHYDELVVGDVMTPIGQIDAVDYARLGVTTVGDAIEALRRFGRNHLLVVDGGSQGAPHQGTTQRVRGVISRSQIERQLGVLIDTVPVADSFADIERALV